MQNCQQNQLESKESNELAATQKDMTQQERLLKDLQSLTLKQNDLKSDKRLEEQQDTKRRAINREFFQKHIQSVRSDNSLIEEQQIEHYPYIGWKQAEEILNIWQSPKQKNEETLRLTKKIKFVDKIRNLLIKRIRPKIWLNDEVVNAYIDLLREFASKENQKNDCLNEKSQTSETKNEKPTSVGNLAIMNSFFIVLEMSQTLIYRQIHKKGFSKQNTFLIPINQQSHWFFVSIDRGYVTIYDSHLATVKADQQKQYRNSKSIKNVAKFHQLLHGQAPRIKVCTACPQQINGFDCGVMMLLGMRDLITRQIRSLCCTKTGKQITEKGEMHWNFDGKHNNYRRMQISVEILREQLYLNEQPSERNARNQKNQKRLQM